MPEIYIEQLEDGIWQRTIRIPYVQSESRPCDPLNELIGLTETNLSFLSKAMKELQAEVRPLMLAPRRVEPERFIAFRNRVKQLCQQLPEKNKDHALTGNYIGFRECHIQSDWILIYAVSNTELILTASRTGTHSDLFDE